MQSRDANGLHDWGLQVLPAWEHLGRCEALPALPAFHGSQHGPPTHLVGRWTPSWHDAALHEPGRLRWDGLYHCGRLDPGRGPSEDGPRTRSGRLPHPVPQSNPTNPVAVKNLMSRSFSSIPTDRSRLQGIRPWRHRLLHVPAGLRRRLPIRLHAGLVRMTFHLEFSKEYNS